ncbi:MAG: Fic family protein [Saprospiraceae bacterium]
MLTLNRRALLDYIKNNPEKSSKEIHEGALVDASYATVKRMLQQLIDERLITPEGAGRGTKYQISHSYSLFYPIDLSTYFEKEIDEREVSEAYNLDLLSSVLPGIALFTEGELAKLNALQATFRENISVLSPLEYDKELERLAIDLSWKSAQIEGNTYSLLETERLLKDKETALGKKKEEAIMLLNHKEALDFIIEDPSYIDPLSISRIEDIHTILMKELGIERNIRQRRVGITGTNYRPLDNEYQIREELRKMCDLVNDRENIFEKALLLLVVISYLRAFVDGNKRTGRIISNAILINNGYCPISFRTISPLDYKKAMLVFYEQNNMQAFKEVFIDQFEFSVRTYF